MRTWPRSLRVKLTLWYTGAMVIVLGVYATGVYTVVSRSASLALDELVRGDFQWAAEMVEQRPDGTLTWFEGTGAADSPWLQVWSPGGDLLYQSIGAEVNPVPAAASLAARADHRIVTVPMPSVRYRVLSGEARVANRPVVLQVARSDAQLQRELHQLLLMLVLGLPLGVAVAGLGGYSLARRALAPVDRMAERARAITAERLSDRLPIENPNEELGRLAAVFNDTLARLEASFSQMKRFTSDVSHELRTPLTAIRSVGEVGLRKRHDERGYRTMIGSMLEEVDRLSCLVDSLLALSRAETGQAKLLPEVIDLAQLAEAVMAHLTILAEEKRQTIEIDRQQAPRCVGDVRVLRQAVINLVDNAIKYSPAGGRISLRTFEAGGMAILEVSDTGPGVDVEPRTLIFDRHYRAENAKAGEVAGAGLGLSIAKWAVEVNGGRLTLEQASAAGSTFRIALPSASGRQQRAAS
jgi:heavy metal sensor kinase